MGSPTFLTLAHSASGRVALHLLCLGLMLLLSSAVLADERDVVSRPVVLVASQAGAAALGESVVLAVPIGNGGHFGFVLNRPTETPLSDLFPEEERVRAVSSRVHLGGPLLGAGVFAIVRGSTSTERPPHPITRELSVALETDEVDGIIEKRAGEARFFLGMMFWLPGALEDEIGAGAWQVFPADAEVVMSRNPASLWPRLAERAAYRPTTLRTQENPK